MKNPGIYILTSPSGKQYVGKSINLQKRVRQHLSGNCPECDALHNAINYYGSKAFSVETIQYPGISDEALSAIERWKIKHLQTKKPNGYNLTDGGEGSTNPSEETRQKLSTIAQHTAKKRLEEGTHHFLGKNNPTHKRIEAGTHHFQDRDFQRQAQKIQKKRVEEGTHHLQSDNHPMKQASKDGTHPFYGSEIARRTAKKRLEEGTHNFQNSEFQQRAKIKREAVNKKRLEEGTHNFQNSEFQQEMAKRTTKRHALKRQKVYWCYIIALSRFWYEIHDYTLKRRAEFLSKDIPDTSNAEQRYLF